MKRVFLYSAGLLLLAAGCTKTDKVPSGEEWVWDESLPVPISFGAGGGLSVETKAAIDELTPEIDIGLFALSVDKSNDNLPTWGTDDATKLLFNEKVNTDEDGTILVKDKYYPNDNVYNYSFYAYAPYSESIVYNPGSYQMNFDLTGDTDIIYGDIHAAKLGGPEQTDVSSRFYGFKASYIRFVKSMKPERPDLLPKITFKHKLTKLSFYAQLVSTESSGESGYTIRNIEILNTTTRVGLIIADKNDAKNTGTLVSTRSGNIFVGGRENALDYTLKYGDYNEAEGAFSQVFLMPGDSFDIRVTYEIATDGGEPIVEHVGATIDRSQFGGFTAGNNYKVKMMITPNENIKIGTELEGWGDIEHGEVPLDPIE